MHTSVTTRRHRPGEPVVSPSVRDSDGAGWSDLGTGPRLLAAAPLLVLVVGVLVGELNGSRPADWLVVVDVTVGVGGALALPFVAIRRPVAAAVAAILVSAVSPTATPLAATATLWVARRRGLRVAIAVATAGTAALVVLGAWRPAVGVGLGWWLALVVASYAALVGWGAWRRAHMGLVASLAERAHRAEQQQAAKVLAARQAERDRIASEMHDVLAHRLTLLTTYAGALEYRADTSPEQLHDAIVVIRDSAHRALAELREVIGVLRSDGQIDPIGSRRPVPTFMDLARLLAECRRAGMTIDLFDHTDGREIPEPAGRTVHRVVQEALTNIRKHAAGAATRVRVAGRPGGRLEVEVVNEPPPTRSLAEVPPGSGTGLIGLGERLAVAGGHLEHGPTREGGYRVWAVLEWLTP